MPTPPDQQHTCPDEREIDESIHRAADSADVEPLLRFIELAVRVPEDRARTLLARNEEWRALRRTLAPRYARYIRDREVEHTRSLIEGSGALKTHEFATRTYGRVKDMFDHIDFASCARFVMVGCGPFPATILNVIDHTAVPMCIGLDTDDRAINLSRRLIERSELSRFKVEQVDGNCYDFSGASVIYVANLTSSKEQLLARISTTARPNTAVILRDPYALGVLIAEAGLEGTTAGLRVTALGVPEVCFLSRHVFLKTDPHDDDTCRDRL